MQEFIAKARDLSTGARGNKHALKEAEIFLQSARKSRTDETFVICTQILNNNTNYAIEPESIVAAQSLCWICKHKQLSGDQFNALLAVLQLLTTNSKPTHPVAVQVIAAISAAIVIGYAPGDNWLRNALQPMLSLGQSNSAAQQRWVSYIVSIVSHIPEIAASKDVMTIISERNCIGKVDAALSPHSQQIVSVLLVQQSVLQESAVVEEVLRMALSVSPGDTALLAACSRCSMLWVEYAASILQSLPAECESAAVLQALEAQCSGAVHCLAMWASSPVLAATMDQLQLSNQRSNQSSSGHANTSNKDALDACMELLVAVCASVSTAIAAPAAVPGKKQSPGPAASAGKAKGNRAGTQQLLTAELAARIDYELQQLARNVTHQLLPVLSAALDAQARNLLSLHSALMGGQQQQCNAEDVFSDCLCVFRGNCDCVTALMDPYFAQLYTNNGQDQADVGPLGQLWTQYLTAFTHSTRAHMETLSALARMEVLSETWELVDPLRELLEVLLPLVTATAEHVTVTGANAGACSTDLQALHVQLTALVHGLVEGTVVAAVTAAAYAEVPGSVLQQTALTSCALPSTALFIPSQSLQQQEDLDDFRNNVRDSLRSLVAVMPNLCNWLLRHTHDAVQAYVTAVRASCAEAGPSSGVWEAAQLGAGWAVAEALLHAVSAVTKQILTSLKTAASGAQGDLYAALHALLQLLVSEEVVSACRPLSRICAVIYGEFASILLERGATDLCAAMMHRLLVSLQHPEAPFAVQCVPIAGVRAAGHIVPSSLPMCLGGLLQPTPLRLFCSPVVGDDNANANISTLSDFGTHSRLMDLLCLQGCSLPFRVKQDHIGAVSLLKVMIALCNSNTSTVSPTSNMLMELPRVLHTLKEVHSQAQGQLSYAILLFQQHMLSSSAGAPGHVLTLLQYCYFYLSILQSAPSRNRSLSPKSFHLVFHSTLASLLCSDGYTSINTIGAILIPTCVATLQCIGAQDIMQVSQAMCAEYSVAANAEVTQAVCELGASLGAHCSLAQLIYTVSAILTAVHAKYKKSRRIQDLQSLLCVVESCAPLLQSLSARAQSRPYSDVELDALCSLFASCRIELLSSAAECDGMPEMSAFATQAVGALQRVYSRCAVLLQHLIGDPSGTGRAELVLPAACSILRCLCSWYSVVDISESFQSVVRELSEQGVRIMHSEQQRLHQTTATSAGNTNDTVNVEDINMRIEREEAQAAGKHRNSGELRSLGVLLQLWSSSLAATELLPPVPPTATASKPTGKADDCGRKLPLAALGEASLQCIVSAVCDLFAPLGTGASSGMPLSLESWSSALAVLALALGPVMQQQQHTLQTAAYIALSADGCIALSALADKTVTCTHSACGVSSIMDCYLSSGLAERIACSLLFALLQSSSDTSIVSTSSSAINAQPALSFPSELRDPCISTLLKYVLCFGATHSAALLSAALAHPACPCNGVIGTQEGRNSWVGRLLTYAAAADWKKFKSTSKTLCRG